MLHVNTVQELTQNKREIQLFIWVQFNCAPLQHYDTCNLRSLKKVIIKYTHTAFYLYKNATENNHNMISYLKHANLPDP